MVRVLVVDDEKIKRVSLADDLAENGYSAEQAASGEEALDKMESLRFDVVIADLKMPGMDGIQLLKQIKTGPCKQCAVIIMTAYGNISLAVEAMKLGAFDFITKPFRNKEIFPLLERIDALSDAAESPSRAESAAARIDERIVGATESIRRMKEMIAICARADSNVLICGETGTGKDLTASVIHQLSRRHSSPFVKVNCSTFPQHLVESELFGHEKGAFTGAESQRKGRFELAAGGTLYLDDVDDISLDHQVKLLRVIEEKYIERVGGNRLIRADVRIIASTKKDLLVRIAEGAMRDDLYHRLNILHIDIPPLRERPEDVPALSEFLLREISGDPNHKVDSDVLEALTSHTWPGNVRELSNTLERAYVMGENSIKASFLRAELGEVHIPSSTGKPGGFHDIVNRTERDLLLRNLRAAKGNKSEAARALGMKLSTFRDNLIKHGIT